MLPVSAVLHQTVSPPYTFKNTVIRLRFDLNREIVYGHETVVIRAARATSSIPFDSSGIRYDGITVDGKAVTYRLDENAERLSVVLPRAVAEGAPLTVDFQYSTRPKAGLYFVKPDAAYKTLTPEIWTQGEPTENRRWFPTWDEPNAKTPSELIVTVPQNWTAVANGLLQSRTPNGADATWDWRSPEPKSTYLIAFAAGPLSRYHSSLRALNVDSYVPPQYAGFNALCFGETPKMIAYYNKLLGVAYPFSKYDQVAAERDFFGGMENESVTIIATKSLHPAIEDTERSCDLVVSHELAQHWFGDDATMMDWSNVWLNEGFATYFDEVWTGERDGKDAFDYARYEAQQTYFEESARGIRPVVDYRYTYPLELFGATGHEGPAERIHMLRYLVGDRRFFAALRNYLIAYHYRNATTDDFFASIERSLGMNLRWFKDEWFFRAAYPAYNVRFNFDRTKHQVMLDVAQSSADGKPFRMPVEIDAYVSGHVARTRTIIDSADQRVTIGAVDAMPDMILFDPGNNIVRRLEVIEPVTMLAYQALHAPDVPDRLWAIDRLHDVAVLHRAAISDRFYGVRAAAMTAAAKRGDSDTVLAALSDSDVRVRLVALDATAALRNPGARIVSKVHELSSSSNPDVAAAALVAIGRLHLPDAYATLAKALDVSSFRQTIAGGALDGLAALGDERGFALIVERTAYGVDENERNHAVTDLASIAKVLHRERRALTMLLPIAGRDRIVSTRLTAISALASLGDRAATPSLERLAQDDPLEVVRVSAAGALSAMRQP